MTEVTLNSDSERGSLHSGKVFCQTPFYSLKGSSQHFK